MPPRDRTSSPGIDLIEDIMRREILKGVLALPIQAAGISCGDDEDADGTPSPTAPVPTTRVVRTALGRTARC